MSKLIPSPSRGAFAVWRRNVKVWQRLMRVSLVLNFGEPLIYLLAFGYGFGQLVPELGGLSYLSFIASGIIVSSVMNTTSFEAMYSVYTRMDPQKTYAGMLVSPLQVDDIVLGELLWCATKGLIAGSTILLVGTALGALTIQWSMLFVLPLMLLTGFACAGMTIILAPFANGYDYFSYFYTLVMVPMMLCSGVFFPIEQLPAAVGYVAQALPLYHAIELARPLVTGGAPDQFLIHILVLIAYAVAGYTIAVPAYRRRLLT